METTTRAYEAPFSLGIQCANSKEKKSDPSKPFLAQASTTACPQRTSQENVHNQPMIPPTRLPVACFQACSITTPTPCMRKNPATASVSAPRPIPCSPTSCRTPETAKAPMTIPARPRYLPEGLLPTATNPSRKSWCHLRPQRLLSEVDNQGESKRGGHCDGYCRNSIVNNTACTWYVNSMLTYPLAPESTVTINAFVYRSGGGSDGSKIVPPFGVPNVSGPSEWTDLRKVSNPSAKKVNRQRESKTNINRDSTWKYGVEMCILGGPFHPIPLRFTMRSKAFHIAEKTGTPCSVGVEVFSLRPLIAPFPEVEIGSLA